MSDIKYSSDISDNQKLETKEGYIIQHAPPPFYRNPYSGVKALVFWFVLTAGTSLYFCLTQYELWTIYFFLIQGMIGFVLFFTSDLYRRQKNMLLYTAIIAAVSAGIVLLRISLPQYFFTVSGRFMTNLLFSNISAIGGSFLVYAIVHDRKMQRRCTDSVNGTVTRLKSNPYGIRKTFSPVYRFSYGDKKYEASEFKYYKHSLPQVNDIVKLMLDPQDPVTIPEPYRARRTRRFYTLIGLVLLLLGFGLMMPFAVTGIGIFEK